MVATGAPAVDTITELPVAGFPAGPAGQWGGQHAGSVSCGGKPGSCVPAALLVLPRPCHPPCPLTLRIPSPQTGWAASQPGLPRTHRGRQCRRAARAQPPAGSGLKGRRCLHPGCCRGGWGGVGWGAGGWAADVGCCRRRAGGSTAAVSSGQAWSTACTPLQRDPHAQAVAEGPQQLAAGAGGIGLLAQGISLLGMDECKGGSEGSKMGSGVVSNVPLQPPPPPRDRHAQAGASQPTLTSRSLRLDAASPCCRARAGRAAGEGGGRHGMAARHRHLAAVAAGHPLACLRPACGLARYSRTLLRLQGPCLRPARAWRRSKG